MAKDSSPREPSPEEVQKMLGQALLTGIVSILLLVFSFSYFMWKQNQQLGEVLMQLSQQSKGAQNFDTFYNNFIYDLSMYSQQHPEVLQMLAQSGIEIQQTQRPKAGGPMPPLPAPPAPPAQ